MHDDGDHIAGLSLGLFDVKGKEILIYSVRNVTHNDLLHKTYVAPRLEVVGRFFYGGNCRVRHHFIRDIKLVCVCKITQSMKTR